MKKIVREKNLLNEKMIEKNMDILKAFLISGVNKVTVKDLQEKGFKENYIDARVESLSKEIIYVCGNYSLHRNGKNENEFIITKD